MLTVDDREHTQHPDVLDKLAGLPLVVDRLDAADYAFLDVNDCPIGIERATIGNFVQKLRSGELEDQLTRCSQQYTTVILLLEEVYDRVDSLLALMKRGNRGFFRTNVYPHTRYRDIKAAELRLSEMGFEVIHSNDFDDSMEIIRTLYTQRRQPDEERSLFRKTRVVRLPSKLTTNPAVPALRGLCSRLPEKVAIRLIHKFDNIWSVLNAEDREILEVEGMGKGLLVSLKKGVGKE